jgi:hypothetical protein
MYIALRHGFTAGQLSNQRQCYNRNFSDHWVAQPKLKLVLSKGVTEIQESALLHGGK